LLLFPSPLIVDRLLLFTRAQRSEEAIQNTKASVLFLQGGKEGKERPDNGGNTSTTNHVDNEVVEHDIDSNYLPHHHDRYYYQRANPPLYCC
jgi:hypothetical protein